MGGRVAGRGIVVQGGEGGRRRRTCGRRREIKVHVQCTMYVGEIYTYVHDTHA